MIQLSNARIETLMMETGVLTKDVGTILVGEQAVAEGLIDEVGGIDQALEKLHSMIDTCKVAEGLSFDDSPISF